LKYAALFGVFLDDLNALPSRDEFPIRHFSRGHELMQISQSLCVTGRELAK